MKSSSVHELQKATGYLSEVFGFAPINRSSSGGLFSSPKIWIFKDHERSWFISMGALKPRANTTAQVWPRLDSRSSRMNISLLTVCCVALTRKNHPAPICDLSEQPAKTKRGTGRARNTRKTLQDAMRRGKLSQDRLFARKSRMV